MTTPTEGADTGMSDSDFDQLVTMVAGNDMGGHSIGSFFRDGETHYVTINDLLSEVSRLRADLAAARMVGDEEVNEALVHLDIMGGGRATTGSAKAASVIRRLSAYYSAACGERDAFQVYGKNNETLAEEHFKRAIAAEEQVVEWTVRTGRAVERADAAESQLSLALVERDRAREALRFVLPLAKGYAAEHPVGANQQHVNHAVEVLDALNDTQEKK